MGVTMRQIHAGLFILLGLLPGVSGADGLMDALAGKSKQATAPVPAPAVPVSPAPVSQKTPPVTLPAAPVQATPAAPAPAKEVAAAKKPADPPPVKLEPPPAVTPKAAEAGVPNSAPRAKEFENVDDDSHFLSLLDSKRSETLKADIEEQRKRRRAAENWDVQSSAPGQPGATAWKPLTVYAIEIRGKKQRALIGYGNKPSAWYSVGGRGNIQVTSITEDTVVGKYMNTERRWEAFQGSVYDAVAYPVNSMAYPGAPGVAGGQVPGQAPAMPQPMPVR